MCSVVREQRCLGGEGGCSSHEEGAHSDHQKMSGVFSLLCQSVWRGQVPQVVTEVRVRVCTGLTHGYDDLLLLSAAVAREGELKRCEHEIYGEQTICSASTGGIQDVTLSSAKLLQNEM